MPGCVWSRGVGRTANGWASAALRCRDCRMAAGVTRGHHGLDGEPHLVATACGDGWSMALLPSVLPAESLLGSDMVWLPYAWVANREGAYRPSRSERGAHWRHRTVSNHWVDRAVGRTVSNSRVDRRIKLSSAKLVVTSLAGKGRRGSPGPRTVSNHSVGRGIKLSSAKLIMTSPTGKGRKGSRSGRDSRPCARSRSHRRGRLTCGATRQGVRRHRLPGRHPRRGTPVDWTG